jgi:hypothetical protein
MGGMNVGAIAAFFQTSMLTQRRVQVVHKMVHHWQNEGRVDTSSDHYIGISGFGDNLAKY